MSVEILQQHRVHGGTLSYCRHASAATGTPMRFSVFLPQADGPVPYLIWLSGLTCTEDNFTTKAGAYAAAARAGVAMIAPDTSPRGEGVADDPAYDLGQGAGFYVDAVQAPWAAHFQMESYVVRDLIAAVEGAFPLDGARRGVFGHSMGGHGALTLTLRHPELFKSVSAFAPICSPTRCAWGQKAFTAYLGPDEAAWREHDAALLVEAGRARVSEILVDQGTADNFLADQLKPELLKVACEAAGVALTLRMQEGYDHSYFFMTSFVADHVAWHAERL
ncbi:S-formylglutathione hydrolase [Phenylobacterium sp. Root700]|uniref:S-formylglutathione hydrolase n=1 Tax=Phenylobacterium sp. Root700 TaxID=1736591 RepID=UPI0006FB7D54|nr:S-formylglutathione hydrolase [Phenylobacterium sp. Root700]KRB52440.1 S-formylglutathione hydrolase [Phenylobacterium sp. Root700]